MWDKDFIVYGIERQQTNNLYTVVRMTPNGQTTEKVNLPMHKAEQLAKDLNEKWGRQ